jgi:serine/threonine protein kinase
VFLARMTSSGGLEQHVAVKLLQQGLDPRSQAVERLRDEARTLASLRHPVLLAALDLVELGGRVALVTEYVEGQDLSACIEGEGRMQPATLLEVIGQVASGLDAAWQQLAVVHRDLKPQNIRIGRHGHVKLLDFGIARSMLQGRAARTQSAVLVGTLRYLAPERFELEEDPEPASDIFALGCVLYEGLGTEPFVGEHSLAEVCRLAMVPSDWARFLDRRLEPLQGLPDGVSQLLRDLLTHSPAQRPTAAEVAQRCEDLLGGQPASLRLSRWCRSRRWPQGPLPHPGSPSASSGAPGTRWQRSTPQVPAPPPAVSPHTAPSLLGPPPPKEAPKRAHTGSTPRRLGRWAALAALGGLALPTGGALLLGVLLLGLWWSWVPAPASPVTAPLTAPVPAPIPALVSGPVPPLVSAPVEPPEPVEPPVPEPPPQVGPAPAPPRPAPVAPVAPVPAVAPAPVEAPVPAPAPAPVPAPAAPTWPVVISSIPAGVEIRLLPSGELLGLTPLARELPAGELQVSLIAPDGATLKRSLQIGEHAPRRYVWRISEGRFDAGY